MQHLDLIGNDKLFSVNLSTNEKGGTLMMKSFFTLLFLIVTLLSNLFSKVISVPKDFVKIQVALDASSDGDTILVEKGLYKENIDFYGKKVVVTSRFNDSGDTRFIKKTIIYFLVIQTKFSFLFLCFWVSRQERRTIFQCFLITR